jgi:hypothetical protein
VLTASNIDLAPINWAVRHQGDRGTCVAFATAACYEFALFGSAGSATLSEQFLFWAAKTAGSDPDPNVDGTLLDYARNGLVAVGVCAGSLWPYSGQIFPNNVTHAVPAVTPSASALGDALARRIGGLHRTYPIGGSAAAEDVLDALKAGWPVAVTVPIFTDPNVVGGSTNWNSAAAQFYGEILDPPANALSTEYGHAVCITGFFPDPDEPTGGFFIFRNSWGTQQFGSALPDPSYFAREPGYGQISATYLRNFAWETFVLPRP